MPAPLRERSIGTMVVRDSKPDSNKRTVLAFYQVAINGKDIEGASRLVGRCYIQHDPRIADGVEGLNDFINYLRDTFPELCLAAVRQATLAELAEASGASLAEVRLALRRLAEREEPAGMQVLDDGNAVQLGPLTRFGAAVRQLTEPRRHPGLTPGQTEVLAIVIAEGMATRGRIEDVRRFSQSRIGPAGVMTIPRDCSETLALLGSRGS